MLDYAENVFCHLFRLRVSKKGKNVPVELIKGKFAHSVPSIYHTGNLLADADPGACVQTELLYLCGQRQRRGVIAFI